MSDKPRCPSCGHPLDQAPHLPEHEGATGFIPEWSRCDEGCRHGGQGRYTNAAGTRMRAWVEDASIGQLLSEEPGARFETRDRWPVEVECARCEGVLGDGCCTRCLGTGRVTVCHTCAEGPVVPDPPLTRSEVEQIREIDRKMKRRRPR